MALKIIKCVDVIGFFLLPYIVSLRDDLIFMSLIKTLFILSKD